jgi:hypothetical protein
MLTREQVIDIVGRIEDWKIAQIISTKATGAELLEAHTSVIEEGDLEAETGRALSGTIARLYDMLTADEPRWPDSDDTP